MRSGLKDMTSVTAMACLVLVLVAVLGAAPRAVSAEESPVAVPPAKSRPVVSDAGLEKWVEKWTRALQPADSERRFDEIGWVTAILDAERLAREHGRPVFLFTYDGQMATGRC